MWNCFISSLYNASPDSVVFPSSFSLLLSFNTTYIFLHDSREPVKWTSSIYTYLLIGSAQITRRSSYRRFTFLEAIIESIKTLSLNVFVNFYPTHTVLNSVSTALMSLLSFAVQCILREESIPPSKPTSNMVKNSSAQGY